MLLKLYAFLLLSSCAMQAMDQEIPMLKNICADVIAKEIHKQLPVINSYKSLKDAYVRLNNIPLFQQLTMSSDDIHAVIARAYQKLHSSELLLPGKRLGDHIGYIFSIAYSPDGKQLASGSLDGVIKIWNIGYGTDEPGICIKMLSGHTNSIKSVVYSPDGTQLASGSTDNVIKIWDLKTYNCIQTLRGHNDAIWSVAYNPTGIKLASGSADHTIKIWDLEYGICIKTLQDHDDLITSIVYSPSGSQLASGSKDNTIKIWDSETYECIQTLIGHNGWIFSVAYSFYGLQVASGSRDNTIKIWDLGSYRCVKTLDDHKGLVRCVAYSPGSKQQLVSAANDGTLKIWDPGIDIDESDACIKTLKNNYGGSHHNFIFCFSYSPDGKQLASCSDNTIKIWESYDQEPKTIKDVLFSILSSLYITYDPQKFSPESMYDTVNGFLSSYITSYKPLKSTKLMNLYNSVEFEQLSDNHKQDFISYIRRYAAEYPNSPVKELAKFIQQKSAKKLVEQDQERGLANIYK